MRIIKTIKILNKQLINSLLISLYTLFCFGFTLQAYGQGGPPLLTDDPGTVEKGHFEINFGLNAEHTKPESLIDFPFVDINYGISEQQHINFEIPLVTKFENGADIKNGIGRVGVGTKFRFLNQENAGLSVSTHPNISFCISKQSVSNEIVDDETELFIPIEFERDFNQNILGMEFGRLINSKSQDLWTFGALYARELSSHTNIAIEINGDTHLRFNNTIAFLNFGTRIAISEKLKILFSVGRSIVLPENTHENIFIGYMALQVAI